MLCVKNEKEQQNLIEEFVSIFQVQTPIYPFVGPTGIYHAEMPNMEF